MKRTAKISKDVIRQKYSCLVMIVDIEKNLRVWKMLQEGSILRNTLRIAIEIYPTSPPNFRRSWENNVPLRYEIRADGLIYKYNTKKLIKQIKRLYEVARIDGVDIRRHLEVIK